MRGGRTGAPPVQVVTAGTPAAPVEEIARLVGFGTAAGLRDQFSRRRGVSPRAYRQTFRAASLAGTLPVQLHQDRLRAGRVRGDHALVEAELGQPA